MTAWERPLLKLREDVRFAFGFKVGKKLRPLTGTERDIGRGGDRRAYPAVPLEGRTRTAVGWVCILGPDLSRSSPALAVTRVHATCLTTNKPARETIPGDRLTCPTADHRGYIGGEAIHANGFAPEALRLRCRDFYRAAGAGPGSKRPRSAVLHGADLRSHGFQPGPDRDGKRLGTE